MRLPLLHSLTHLPQEVRVTLLLALTLMGIIAPHLMYLPWWCVLLALMALVWRAALGWTQRSLPSKTTLMVLLSGCFGLTWLAHHSFVTKDAGITLAVMLVAVKTLESRSWRDSFVLFMVGVFLILTHFLYSQSIFAVLVMVLTVWSLLTWLVLSQARLTQPRIGWAATHVAKMCLWGAPLMVALFVLFPRIEPFWGLPQQGGTSTGLTDHIRLGSIAELTKDETITMHIEFDQGLPPQQALYFRAVVLSDFDGLNWRTRPGFVPMSPSDAATMVLPLDKGLAYSFTLEPQSLTSVPALELTTNLSSPALPSLQQDRQLVWHTEEVLLQKQRFTGQVHSQYALGRPAYQTSMSRYLNLPEGFNPRLHQLAKDILDDPRYRGADETELIALLLRTIKSGGFRYTLTPGTYGYAQGRFALDEFWFDRKAGFCEHFASAVAVLLRELRIPSRIVIGYQGVEYNPVGHYHVVRNSHAHAWVEYWHAQKGWQRLDPSVAIPPNQVASEAQLRPPPGINTQASLDAQSNFMRTVRHRWEDLALGWSEWVVNYSSQQQLDLLKRLGIQTPSFMDLVWAMIGVSIVLILLTLLSMQHQKQKVDPWLQCYQRMQTQIAASGLVHEAHLPPRSLAQRVMQAWGGNGQAVAEVLLQMEALRYAPASMTASEGKQLRQLMQTLQQSLPRASLPTQS